MRAVSAVVAVCLLIAWPLALDAAPATEPGGHEITCSSPRAAREYRDALRQLHLGRAAEAAAGFREVLRRDPRCAMAYFGLSRAQHKAGQAHDALSACAKAEELAP